MSLRSLTYTTLAALYLLVGCQLGTQDQDEDTPAAPLEVEDAASVLAAQICDQLFTCTCDEATDYPSKDACVDDQRQRIQGTIDDWVDSGGSWDAQCAGELPKALSKWQCLGPDLAALEYKLSPRSCPILKGTLGEGDECYGYYGSSHEFAGDCSEGLICVERMCDGSTVLPVPEGQVCGGSWERLPCEAGTWCYDNGVDLSRCAPLPKAGDYCDSAINPLCGPASNDLYCDGATFTCVQAPGAGEPCWSGYLCGPGTYCDGGKDFTCQPRREIGQSCAVDAVCTLGTSCVDNVCAAQDPQVCRAADWFSL